MHDESLRRTGVAPKLVCFAISLLSLALLVPDAHAFFVGFDFENVAATWNPVPPTRPGALSSLVMSSGGLTVTLTRTTGSRFDIVNNVGGQAGKPASWGAHSLDPFFNLPLLDKWLVDFSLPVKSFSIEFGDYAPSDDDTPVDLRAWSGHGGTGSLVGTDSDVWRASEGFPNYKTLSYSGGNALSAYFYSDGIYPNSVFWDNMELEVVPEPTVLTLLGVGAAGLLLRRKRKH